MPELPEVETVRRGLAPALEGARLARVVLRRADLRFPFPQDLVTRLTGRRIQRLGRRAKYLLMHLDDGATLLCHLGMSGRYAVLEVPIPEPEAHDHMDLVTDAGICVRYTDPRRFGFVDWIAPGEANHHPMLREIGPEPLSNDFNGPMLAAALEGKRGPIKMALLDQKVVAGLGNIYVCESLFRAGLSPKRRAGTVTGKRAENLVAAIRDTLTQAIAAGGSTLNDHRQPDGDLGYFQHAFAVYGREGEACPGCTCDRAKTGGITRLVQSGRSTFYCAARQR
ncbi:bifunctional DNA-formamidopyrimidine glycosylase/DNA-(apurinic or apyrimidinic site) lyase [Magnetospira sp. QH-2]|uniref:bifunctional DNA-formamidopyrimidine glycosylase/DNA-(apurinic or apyrimidinic site) lyase n=1 Tax=Magnetospira sp. (strain QH-2) TaxID=1288970 RepID=UPI0003E810CF|nr:bifunctional DNA-formamidopyrimidine glycosylase/DNA-(apurinic or apyrimidinic site) lyase [Magnetospira sp. QH-2]CCQ75737.1 Formamidopyrimidine-DNA glycosylase [Magnetospira sp. QH-2]